MVFGEESTMILGKVAASEGGADAADVAGGFDGIVVRGARAMLGLSQAALCAAAGCGRNTLNDFENGLRTPGTGKVADIKAALEAAGAEFVEDPARGIAVRVDRTRAAGRTPRARTIGDGKDPPLA